MDTERLNTAFSHSQQASKIREQQQHAPRPARLRFSAKTHGVGETRSSVSFGAFALDEPSFTWGVQALGAIRYGDIPSVTAIVLRYHLNEHGLYVGADMGYSVTALDINIRLQFSLTFESSTMRSTAGTVGATASGTSSASGAVFRR